jgi:2,4-dienoyl-CoA reductase-like NADH-dependent reductase (Old Yellow Enzyme family)
MRAALFEPMRLRSVDIRNRIWVSPMCQYSVFEGDGVPTDWHLAHLGSFARGGAGMVMAEATAVNPVGRITPHDTGLWNEQQVTAWARITKFIRSQGAVAAIQLGHAGRKASAFPEWSDERVGTIPTAEGGWTPLAPSEIPMTGHDVPAAMTIAGIREVVGAFALAAERAARAGFEVVEIHAAHGYLLHEFLSPLSNRRDDEYGGVLENRARVVLETVRAVRAAIPAGMPLLLRLSGTDYVENGWTVEETATLAVWARDAGADFFDISSGGNVTGASIPIGPGYQVPLARYVKETAGVEVSAVGLIVSPAQANEIVATGAADAVMLGREFMRDPHFPLTAAAELGRTLDYWPPQYRQAEGRRFVASR